MNDYFEHKSRLEAVKEAEESGRVADSMEVRKQLIDRMKAGEITFDQMQAELKQIKRNAKKQGKVTRGQAYKGY